MKKLICIVSVILFLIVSPLYLTAQEYKNHPGYIDFGDLEGFKDSEETVEVFIRGPLLKFVAKATAHEDPDLSQLLNDLLLIKVDVFEIDRDERDKVKSIMEKASKKLDSKKWERMVRVKKRREHAEVFTRFGKNDELVGLVVMALDDFDDEAVFVNIVGKIDPNQLAKLSNKFDIPEIDSIKIERKKK